MFKKMTWSVYMGPHRLYLKLDFFIGRDVHERGENNQCIKTCFNTENVKVGKSKSFHLNGSFIHWSTGKD